MSNVALIRGTLNNIIFCILVGVLAIPIKNFTAQCYKMLGISWFKTIYLYIRIIVGKLKLNPGGKNKQNVNILSQQVKWLHVESDQTLFINYFLFI